MSFRIIKRAQMESKKLRPQVLQLYRECLKTCFLLQDAHQEEWYIYTQNKFRDAMTLNDDTKVRQLLRDGREELEWVKKVVAVKNMKKRAAI